MKISRYRSFISISTKSLGLFRIGIGLLLIADILLRSRNFWYYYTERGVVPYAVAKSYEHVSGVGTLPIWDISTHYLFVGFIFITALIVGVLLTIGWKSRLMTVLAFILVTAIDARNPFVLSYADIYFHKLLFFAMFLPLGSTFSIDTINNNSERYDKNEISSVWSAAILSQIVVMYFMNGLLKIFPDPSHIHKFLPMLIEYDYVTFSHATLLDLIPTPLLEVSSIIWALLLFSAPFTLLMTKKTLRATAVAPFILAHVIMAFGFRIGAFPYIAIVALVLFIQDDIWEVLLSRSPTQTDHTANAVRGVKTKIKKKKKEIRRIHPLKAINLQEFKPTFNAPNKNHLILLLLVGLLLFNTTTTVLTEDNHVNNSLHEGFDETIEMIGMTQPSWGFYAKMSFFSDEWYIYEAYTESGDRIDVYNPPSSTISLKRPYNGSNLHKQYDRTYRDRFYELILHSHRDKYQPLVEAKLDYICRQNPYNRGKIMNVTMKKVYSPYNYSTRKMAERPRTVHEIGAEKCSI